VCCGVSAMTANTLSIHSSGTLSWNRSDIELTNHVVGTLRLIGISSAFSEKATRPVQTAFPFTRLVVPLYCGARSF